MRTIIPRLYLPRTITLTLNDRVTIFPAGSLNVYVTVVVPGVNELPGCLSVDGMTVPELSVTVGVGQDTGVLVVPNGTVTVMSSGKVVTCGIYSISYWMKKYKVLDKHMLILKSHVYNI